MKKHVPMLTTSAFILACSAIPTSAQQNPGMSMMQKSDQMHQQLAERDGGQGGMMGRGMMGHGGLSAVPIRIIFALMDGDGDGTISLQEFQAAHERIFKAMDANKDGVLTPEEMQAFMLGTGKSAPQQ